MFDEPLGVQGIEHYLSFCRIKSPGGGRPVLRGQRLSADPFAIDPGSENPKNSAGDLAQHHWQASRQPPSCISFVLGQLFQGYAQHLGDFFLDVDYGFGLPEALG